MKSDGRFFMNHFPSIFFIDIVILFFNDTNFGSYIFIFFNHMESFRAKNLNVHRNYCFDNKFIRKNFIDVC